MDEQETGAGEGRPRARADRLRGRRVLAAIESPQWAARYAIDGDALSRWSSGFSDPQWLRVDLGRPYRLTTVTLKWENAYGMRYRVETSLDGATWHTLWSTTSGHGGTVGVPAAGTAARYVRMYGTQRVNQYGFSLYEVEVR
nr:discoidin domain-containing protein [uncultured Actinoplanes sp.]